MIELHMTELCEKDILIDLLENGEYLILENVFGRVYQYTITTDEVKNFLN